MGMKDLFKDVLGIEGVHGVVCLTTEGTVVHSQFTPAHPSDYETVSGTDWSSLVRELSGIGEAEIVFDAGRLYIRKSSNGYLIVILNDHAPVSMVRLHCDVLMPALDKQKFSKGFGQLLRKKIF
jgi:hypothetical protein